MSLKKIDIKKISFIIFLSLPLSLPFLSLTARSTALGSNSDQRNKTLKSLHLSPISIPPKPKKNLSKKKKQNPQKLFAFSARIRYQSKTHTSLFAVDCVRPQRNTRVFIAVVIITSIIFRFVSSPIQVLCFSQILIHFLLIPILQTLVFY